MAENLAQRMSQIPDRSTREPVRFLNQYFYDELSSVTLSSPGLAITGAGSAIVKAGTAFYAIAQGVLLTKAANQAMPALVGTVANARFNVFCFFVDSAGALTSAMGTAGTTLATILWPTCPQNKAMLGFVIINPTGTGSFVGGTTALDDATVVPNAVYINTVGGLDPTATYLY